MAIIASVAITITAAAVASDTIERSVSVGGGAFGTSLSNTYNGSRYDVALKQIHHYGRANIGAEIAIGYSNLLNKSETVGAEDIGMYDMDIDGQFGYMVSDKLNLYGLLGVRYGSMKNGEPGSDSDYRNTYGGIYGGGIDYKLDDSWAIGAKYKGATMLLDELKYSTTYIGGELRYLFFI